MTTSPVNLVGSWHSLARGYAKLFTDRDRLAGEQYGRSIHQHAVEPLALVPATASTSAMIGSSKVLTTDHGFGGALGRGWHNPETWAVWTNETVSWLRFRFAPGAVEFVKLELTMAPFSSTEQRQILEVSRPGGPITTVHFTSDDLHTLYLVLSRRDAGTDDMVELRFETRFMVVPSEIGTSGDQRMLGIALLRIEATPIECLEGDDWGAVQWAPAIVSAGRRLSVGTGLEDALVEGWYAPAANGISSKQDTARIVFRLDSSLSLPCKLDIAISAASVRTTTRQILICSRGKSLCHIQFDEFTVNQVATLSIGENDIDDHRRLVLDIVAAEIVKSNKQIAPVDDHTGIEITYIELNEVGSEPIDALVSTRPATPAGRNYL